MDFPEPVGMIPRTLCPESCSSTRSRWSEPLSGTDGVSRNEPTPKSRERSSSSDGADEHQEHDGSVHLAERSFRASA